MNPLVFKSNFPDVNVPLQDLPTFYFGRMRQHATFTGSDGQPPRPLLVDSSDASQVLTLDELESFTTQLASGMHHTVGVRPGDMVAIVLPNTIYYLAISLAVLMLGATCTTANPAYTAEELARQLADAQAKFIITSRASLQTISSAIGLMVQPPPSLMQLHRSVLCIEKSTAETATDNPILSIFDVQSQLPFPRIESTDLEYLRTTPAFVCYSSGTTGLPKGAVLSHHNITANIMQICYALSQVPTSDPLAPASIIVLPMFHIFGLVSALSMTISGHSTSYMRSFDLTKFLKLVETFQVTMVMLVPSIINAMIKQASTAHEHDLSSLQWIFIGSGLLSNASVASFEQIYGSHIQIMQGYGLTENSGALSISIPTAKRLSSSGPILPNIEAKVIDDSGQNLSYGKVGELCFRGPNIMMGYLNNSDATKATIDTDGFLLTGDIGYIDENQFVF
ncbi:hypothetical protein GGI04_005445, partial [Coemansia thaxteri]